MYNTYHVQLLRYTFLHLNSESYCVAIGNHSYVPLRLWRTTGIIPVVYRLGCAASFLHRVSLPLKNRASLAAAARAQSPARGQTAEPKHCRNYCQVIEKDVRSLRDYLLLIWCSRGRAEARFHISSCASRNMWSPELLHKHTVCRRADFTFSRAENHGIRMSAHKEQIQT